MPSLDHYCDQLCQHFGQLFALTEDQSSLHQEVRQAIQNKTWGKLDQNLQRLESLACEQGRLSKKILELRSQLQQQLPTDSQQLLKISELLPLLPATQCQRLRKIWQELRHNLARRQSELQVLQHYSQGKQEIIEAFLAALKDDEDGQGQVYGPGGNQYHSGAAAPARIFNGEA